METPLSVGRTRTPLATPSPWPPSRGPGLTLRVFVSPRGQGWRLKGIHRQAKVKPDGLGGPAGRGGPFVTVICPAAKITNTFLSEGLPATGLRAPDAAQLWPHGQERRRKMLGCRRHRPRGGGGRHWTAWSGVEVYLLHRVSGSLLLLGGWAGRARERHGCSQNEHQGPLPPAPTPASHFHLWPRAQTLPGPVSPTAAPWTPKGMDPREVGAPREMVCDG